MALAEALLKVSDVEQDAINVLPEFFEALGLECQLAAFAHIINEIERAFEGEHFEGFDKSAWLRQGHALGDDEYADAHVLNAFEPRFVGLGVSVLGFFYQVREVALNGLEHGVMLVEKLNTYGLSVEDQMFAR